MISLSILSITTSFFVLFYKIADGVENNVLPYPDLFACQPPHETYPFCNTDLSIDVRLQDLIKRIPNKKKIKLLQARGMGHVKEIGVPAYYWGTNCLHSLSNVPCVIDEDTDKSHCPTDFPSGPSFAATFDRSLIREMGDIIGQELRTAFLFNATPGLDCWGPVINLNRDPRWGRNAEGGTEDPYLMGEFAKEWALGFQKETRQKSNGRKYIQGVMTLKHMAANSLENSEWYTRYNISVNLTNYQLQDYYLYPFKKGIREGNAKGIMCSYNAINRVPTCLNPLMRAARNLYGFNGYVTSDTDSIDNAFKELHGASSLADSCCRAIKLGHCDINSGGSYLHHLQEAIDDPSLPCTMDDVDKAIYNSMKMRFELGLFDPKIKQDFLNHKPSDLGSDHAMKVSIRASEESIVLLRNDNVLPIKPAQRISVIGPHATGKEVLIQPYPTQFPCDSDRNIFECIKSPYEAIKLLNLDGQTSLAPGCHLFDDDKCMFDEALNKAKEADIVVLVLGIQTWNMNLTSTTLDKSTNFYCGKDLPFWQNTCADGFLEYEAHDRISIDLPGIQHKLAAAIFKLHKPTVVILLNGGQVAIKEELLQQETKTAIIEAFYPGKEGAIAIANSMFGKSNRWGRMPYTVYESDWVNKTSMAQHDLSADGGRTHRYYTGQPLIKFGYGLSLTEFRLHQLKFRPGPHTEIISIMNDANSKLIYNSSPFHSKIVDLTISLTNAGSLMGDAVITGTVNPLSMPKQLGSKLLQNLFDFRRIKDIQPKETRTVTFSIDVNSISVADLETGDVVSTPGIFKITFSDGSGSSKGKQVFFLHVIGSQHILEKFPEIDPEDQNYLSVY